MQRLVRAAVLAAVLGAAAAVAIVLWHHHQPERASASRPSAGGPASAVHAAARSIRTVPVDGIDVMLAVPRHPNGRAVLFMHGSDEDASTDLSSPASARLIAALLRAGYAWAEPGTAAENWGDRRSVAEDRAAADRLRARGDRIVVMAASMGALDAVQLLHHVDPLAFIALYPVCDLRSIIAEPAVRAAVTAAVTAAGSSVAAFSPVPLAGPAGLPVLLLASPQDTTVPKAENADVCAAEGRRTGMTVKEITTTGPHGDASNWRPGPILGFLRRHLGG